MDKLLQDVTQLLMGSENELISAMFFAQVYVTA